MEAKQGNIIKMKELKIGEIALITQNCLYMHKQLVTPIPDSKLLLILGRKEAPYLIDPMKYDYDCMLLRKGDTITI